VHGIRIAPRTYEAQRSAAPSKRALWDTTITEILAGIYEPEPRVNAHRDRCTASGGAGCASRDLQLRVGLNSGRVIAGEIGSGALGYTAIGEPFGLAQRMESAAPPDGVTLRTPSGVNCGGPEPFRFRS
jgi:class 3 adenylate cyclase